MRIMLFGFITIVIICYRGGQLVKYERMVSLEKFFIPKKCAKASNMTNMLFK